MNLLILYIAFPFFFEFFLKLCLGISGILTITTAIFMPLPFLILFSLLNKKVFLLKTIFAFLVYVPLFVNVSHVFLFNSEISCGAFMAMFETNVQETLEFLTHFKSFKLLIFVSFYWISFLVLFRLSKELQPIKFRKTAWSLFIVLYSIFCFGDHRYKFPFEKIFFTYVEYKIDTIKNNRLLKNRDKFIFENIKSSIDKDEEELYTIVIGESANRDHMSIYGSQSKTTPKFDSIKNELFVFKNVDSKYCLTFKAMKTILFFDEDFKNGDLLALFKQAGFKTFWLTNHYILENNENIEVLAGKLSDKQAFINRSHYRTRLSSNYDEKLIKHFEEAVQDKAKKKVIFVHLLGSHFPYKKRYPKNFEIFKSKDNSKWLNDIAEYKNSMLYTDHVLFQMLNILKSKNTNSYILYFSDHGEDVTEDPKSPHTHGESCATKPMFEIPFIVWLSDQYKNLNQSFIKNWNLEKQYNTKDVIHSIINLSRLSCDRYNSSRSIFASGR